MSIAPSQISTTTTHLLLRRNTSAAPDEDEDGPSDSHRALLPSSSTAPLLPPSAVRQRSDSVPRLLEQSGHGAHPLGNAVDTQPYAPPAPPSHKRKQSDIPGDVEISPSAFRTSLNLEKIEQGWNDDDDDDSIVYTGVGNTAGLVGGKIRVRWMALTIMTFLALYTTSRRRHAPSYNIRAHEEEAQGYESVGEPIEARIKYNSIEYYSDLSRMGPLLSTGPNAVDYPDRNNIEGMYTYENVCVTKNVDFPKPPFSDTSMRGLIRFTDKKDILKNDRRCVPCRAEEITEQQGTTSGGAVAKTSSVGHPCGMKGLHEMYASSVSDWNTCINTKENHSIMIRTKQSQSPSHVTNVHFFERPTFLLQFTANDRERSLFDTLFSYLPYWHAFRSSQSYPFDGILSHSVEGCLSHSRNWLCEILHHISAFGSAKEILWEQSPDTLYCFRSLYINAMGYQRSLSSGQLNKPLMDEFRDELFRSLALPRPRDMNEIRKKDAKLGMTRPFRIALHANAQHSINVWTGMEDHVVRARGMTKYHGVEFTTIDSFDELTVAEQARALNLADAVIMSTGEHMANAIFATDDTAFVELGCEGFSSIANPRFIGFVVGTHKSVKDCDAIDGNTGMDEKVACVKCVRDEMGSSFSISEDLFHSIVDELIKSHQEKIAFMRDSRSLFEE
ncbi:hypothetical protein HJC23_007633 [Cyclotella cryptica]|uniref:Glycosyltransferase family 61 protein n=1 Tax=Cyclotella cryptica TaxID=29204 RepID=A0ABD3QV27_9STRA|eukprot:CCRYP_002955-RA/>CCRYP_002955-RA protein AED:0.15 eAED:0.15 QI:0/-1/0/1/-1/1/1/0/671